MTSRAKIDLRLAENVARRVAAAGVRDARLQGERELQEILSVPPGRTGRQYTRGSVTRTASAPGEAPATDTGRLRQSIASFQAEQGKNVVAKLGASAEYGKALELGTATIEPRPWVSRIVTEAPRRDRIKRAFDAGARKA